MNTTSKTIQHSEWTVMFVCLCDVDSAFADPKTGVKLLKIVLAGRTIGR